MSKRQGQILSILGGCISFPCFSLLSSSCLINQLFIFLDSLDDNVRLCWILRGSWLTENRAQSLYGMTARINKMAEILLWIKCERSMPLIFHASKSCHKKKNLLDYVAASRSRVISVCVSSGFKSQRAEKKVLEIKHREGHLSKH